MFRKKPVDEKFLKVSKEHTLVFEDLQQLLNALKSEPVSIFDVKDQVEHFAQNMSEHFAMEEEVLFPAALTCIAQLENIDIILQCQKEHGYFEKDLQTMKDYLEMSETFDDKLKGAILEFAEAFVKHGKAEMEIIYQQMDSNRECERLIKGLVLPAG